MRNDLTSTRKTVLSRISNTYSCTPTTTSSLMNYPVCFSKLFIALNWYPKKQLSIDDGERIGLGLRKRPQAT